MNPFVLIASMLLVFVGSAIGWLLFLYRSGRIYLSPNSNRQEKNKRHFVTAIVATLCLASVAVCALLPAANQPIVWIPAGTMLAFVLPLWVVFTELGLRRRSKTSATRFGGRAGSASE